MLTKVIQAFEEEFHGYQALFMFDNATTHMKYAEYSLRVSKINLEDGGKNAKPMRTLLVVNLAHPENS